MTPFDVTRFVGKLFPQMLNAQHHALKRPAFLLKLNWKVKLKGAEGLGLVRGPTGISTHQFYNVVKKRDNGCGVLHESDKNNTKFLYANVVGAIF